jgi:hypothetical protein
LAASAQANPVRARATLLSLFDRSDAIMIGRFDKREETGTNKVGDGFTVVTTRTYFDISSVVKGDARKFVQIDNDEYRYQVQKPNGVPSDTVFSVGASDQDNAPKPGDTVLLFLKADGDGFELADEYDGIRKLNAADQAVYVDRIKELVSMFDGGKPDSAVIAAWLVRCAEQPATRWDGTHELMQGLRHLDWREEKDADGYQRIDPSVAFSHGAEAANALSDDLKNALTQILVNSRNSMTARSTELSEGDRELIALVRRWDPKTAARCIMGQLKSRAFSDVENAGMMSKVSALIDDKRSSELTRDYTRAISVGNGVQAQTTNEVRRVRAADRILETFIRNVDEIEQREALSSN